MDREGNKTMGIGEIVKRLGFELCEFGLGREDTCERCKKLPDKLFFRGPFGGGEYCCLECVLEENKAYIATEARFNELKKDGHTGHCAARMVFGDGECECGKKGIVPGPISRMICNDDPVVS